jgi:ABC-2 type transport system permease protein
VRVRDSALIASPIKTEVKYLNVDSTNSLFVLPTFFALMVLFGSVLLSGIIALREKSNRAYFRNFVTPTWNFTFIMGMFVTALIALVVQMIVLYLGLTLFTDIQISGYLWNISLAMLVGASVFVFMGLMMGHLFKSNEMAILVSISVAFFLVFFSDTFLPIEAMTGSIRGLVEYNPFAVLSSILKKMVIFDASVFSVAWEIFVLVLFALVFLFLTFLARMYSKRRL